MIYNYDYWSICDMWATMELVDEKEPYLEHARRYINVIHNINVIMIRYRVEYEQA